jgi:hypothetical protein
MVIWYHRQQWKALMHSRKVPDNFDWL